jgi:hypothetical protein
MEANAVTGGRETRYYIELGLGCDALLRCKDCRQLVTAETLTRIGSCPCGCRRVVEITTLSEDEMARVESGAIDFPHRAQFLAEFSACE